MKEELQKVQQRLVDCGAIDIKFFWDEENIKNVSKEYLTKEVCYFLNQFLDGKCIPVRIDNSVPEVH